MGEVEHFFYPPIWCSGIVQRWRRRQKQCCQQPKLAGKFFLDPEKTSKKGSSEKKGSLPWLRYYWATSSTGNTRAPPLLEFEI